MIADLAQNTLDGLFLGSSYALLALGFTLIFGVLRRVNLSFGPAIMFGCYAATWAHLNFGAGLLLLALITLAGAVLAGAYVERLCFAPHRNGSPIAAMVASFALWMQFEELATIALPRHLYAFPPLYAGPPLEFGALSLRVESLVMLLAAIVVCALLWWLLYRTRFGVAVRAVIDQPRAAAACRHQRAAHLRADLRPRLRHRRPRGFPHRFQPRAGHADARHVVHAEGPAGDDAGRPGFPARRCPRRPCPRAARGARPVVLRSADRDLLAYLLLFVLLAARVPWMTTRSAS